MFYLSQNKKLILFSVLIFTISLSTILIFIKGPDWEHADSSQLLNSILNATHSSAQEEDVLHDESYYRNILEDESPFFVIAKNGVFQYLNTDFLSTIGYSVDDVENHSLVDLFSLIHPQDITAFMQSFTPVLDSDVADQTVGPYRIKFADGSFHSILSRVKVIRSKDGRIDSVVMTATDFTDSLEMPKKVLPKGKKIRQTDNEGLGRIISEKM